MSVKIQNMIGLRKRVELSPQSLLKARDDVTEQKPYILVSFLASASFYPKLLDSSNSISAPMLCPISPANPSVYYMATLTLVFLDSDLHSHPT